jgi:hypothetical protein
MSNAARSTARLPRPSLAATVLRVAAVALVAAVLIWSLLFADVLSKSIDARTVLAQPAGQLSSPDSGPSQAPAPVTTRTS